MSENTALLSMPRRGLPLIELKNDNACGMGSNGDPEIRDDILIYHKHKGTLISNDRRLLQHYSGIYTKCKINDSVSPKF